MMLLSRGGSCIVEDKMGEGLVMKMNCSDSLEVVCQGREGDGGTCLSFLNSLKKGDLCTG